MVVVTHQSSYNGIDALINVLLMSVLCHTLMAYYIILYQDELKLEKKNFICFIKFGDVVILLMSGFHEIHGRKLPRI